MASVADIHRLIETGDFFHYSQGLYCTDDRSKIGDEILLRSKKGNPEDIFGEAKKVKRLYELETKSIFKLLASFFSQERIQKERLFINIYPSTLLDCKFPGFIIKVLNHFPRVKNRIVFEIIETERVESIPLLKEMVIFLKSLGFFIAIDDVGKGWSSLNMIIELEPHYIKLDHYFSINLSKSLLKQEMITSLLHYAQKFTIKVVIEGIENNDDLATAKLLGIPICQGFLLDEPKPMAI
ncbi:EAL domain-containing protein [Neobacillus sp. PS3-40]|uniref:EAL domain-containing protein n=1 Tax=Neobacillus sp. PS3-40 TaxID=3070679 RepID=UPI0027E1CE34|nr:EAL domain-containing protein [Neobacillus sp. PS3-40]WML42733.1 EAL domain-containing protein [Neobacillus sp. PS3-40]